MIHLTVILGIMSLLDTVARSHWHYRQAVKPWPTSVKIEEALLLPDEERPLVVRIDLCIRKYHLDRMVNIKIVGCFTWALFAVLLIAQGLAG